MPLPPASSARVFYQAAQQRFEDAQFLLGGKRTTAAVYMAGYSVECILKALILSVTPRSQRGDVTASFRGARAHGFSWLRAQYIKRGGSQIPREIAERFILVSTWTTDLRYKPGVVKDRDARTFLQATAEFWNGPMGDFDMAKAAAKPRNDRSVKAILDVLQAYKAAHPKAKIDVQRQNSVSIRIRIIDPDFNKMDLTDRDSKLWEFLEPLPDSVVSQITMLLLLAPKELRTSFANVEFDYPVKSRL